MTTFFLSLLYLAVNVEYNVTYSSKCVWSYCVPFFHFYDLLRLNCQNISFVNSNEKKKKHYTNSNSLWKDKQINELADEPTDQPTNQPETWQTEWINGQVYRILDW